VPLGLALPGARELGLGAFDLDQRPLDFELVPDPHLGALPDQVERFLADLDGLVNSATCSRVLSRLK
jgi:hypothetical protein